MIRLQNFAFQLLLFTPLFLPTLVIAGEMKTWDGRHSIDSIEVTMVYFVPKDRKPLPDWRERVDYYARRITQFHEREYHGQSKLLVKVQPMPFVSGRNTAELREGNGDAIFFKTVREIDKRLNFATGQGEAFPILLVMSEINWRPLDDFYRLKPSENGPKFEGQLIRNRHFPGATSGGARATYIAARRKGWGLVSADGWRVPYSGSDCVAYHEGVGHTVGLPHPQPGNGSVMSLGQYRGWINESWLDLDQKKRMGWKEPQAAGGKHDLFSRFTAIPSPLIPKPGQSVSLKLTWPEKAELKSLQVRYQDDLWGPWRSVELELAGKRPPTEVTVAAFQSPTPVSYRIDAELMSGETVEIWGYFQVRARPDLPPHPDKPSIDLTLSPAQDGNR